MKRNLISTWLQPGVADNKQRRAVSTACRTVGKPLKRFSAHAHDDTRLKSGVNESRLIASVFGGSGLAFLSALVTATVLFAGCGKKEAAPTEAAVADEESGTQVSRDDKGNVLIKISDETQGDMGLLVAQPAAMQWTPELKGYGRVLDPAPLAEMLMELGKAQLIYDNSHQELERMKVLKKESNTSERAFQTAEAAYRQAGADAGVIWFKIQKTYGIKMAEMTGPMVVPPGTQRKWNPVLDALVGARGAFLIRVDLPVSETLNLVPASARIVGLGEGALPVKADFFGDVPAVDPQTQARGYFFLVSTNGSNLVPGMAVTAFIQTDGAAQSGVIIPREAVVRTDGAGWVYVADSSGEGYVRTEIALDHPTDAGWFVTKAVTASDHIVVTGAAQLLSEERKGQGGE